MSVVWELELRGPLRLFARDVGGYRFLRVLITGITAYWDVCWAHFRGNLRLGVAKNCVHLMVSQKGVHRGM